MNKKEKSFLIIVLVFVIFLLLGSSTYATSTRNNTSNSISQEEIEAMVDQKIENAIQTSNENEIEKNTTNATNGNEQAKANGIGMIAAAIATGLACIGSGIAVAVVASSAVGAISEDPSLLGKTIIFAGLAEGIAIYGLIISIMILNKI